MIDLLPTYDVDLPQEPEQQPWELPIQPNITLQKDVVVKNTNNADEMLATLAKVSIGAIGFDTEFSYGSPGVDLKNGQTWHDPKSIIPLILSLAVWVPDRQKVLCYAIDLQVAGIQAHVEQLFQLPVPFVAHFIQAEMHTLWAMELDPVLPQVWDTWVAAKAIDLGSWHENGYGLIALCNRYGINHPFAATKDHLQNSFITYKTGSAFSDQQYAYAMADAEATLQLYLAQQNDVLQAGLSTHLQSVEFPYAIANSQMVWDGVPVSFKRVNELRVGLDQAIDYHRQALSEKGLDNPSSPKQVAAFLQSRGLENRIIHNGKVTTDDKRLEQIEALDPAITHIRRVRRYTSLRGDPLFTGELIGADNRLHPNHRHLAAATGRSSCAAPNITGITKTFRPIVVAPDGRALLELDYAQIEVCIAAAVHDDPDLLKAANSQDVYATMAQQFYALNLTDEEQKLSPKDFKSMHPDLRDKMKVFVLGIIFGMSEQGIADAFGVSLSEAKRQQESFFDSFPGIAKAMEKSHRDGRVRGNAPMVGGLRRAIPNGYQARNQHINTPVQGSAGVVFRKAVVDLYYHFRGTSTQLVLPIHDAVLIECDVEDIQQVGNDAAFIMSAAVRSYFPQLHPKIDINDHDMTCWNKDGRSDALQMFLNDPSFKL